MSALGVFLKKFESRPPHVEALDEIPDMWRWMKSFVVHKINKISEPQSFRVAMHEGWAHLWAKDFMASSDAEFYHDAPVRLVTSLPHGRPLQVLFTLVVYIIDIGNIVYVYLNNNQTHIGCEAPHRSGGVETDDRRP